MSGDAEPVVVVRGGPEASDVVAAVEDAGGVVAAVVAADAAFDTASFDEDADAADVDAVLAVGEAALLSAADGGRSPPVLPVDAGYGRHSLDRPDVARAVDAIASGAARAVRHPVVAVRVDGETAGRALADVTLMTSEPARISEYAVGDGNETVDAFRADGVVAATPLGSAGYARAAGGPVVDSDAGLSVVPVAPYATETDSWVLRPPVTLSVRRDDAPVSLIVDGEVVREVPPDVAVELRDGGEIPLLRVPA